MKSLGVVALAVGACVASVWSQEAPTPAESLVAGIVLGPEGEPLPGVLVALRRVVSPWPDLRTVAIKTTLSGVDGAFRFGTRRGPDLRIIAEKSGFATTEVDASPLDPQLIVRMQQGFEVDGRVELSPGRGVPDCTVVLEPAPFSPYRAISTRTDSTGRFSFRDVPAAGARLVARHPAFRPVTEPAVEVGGGTVHFLRLREKALSLRGLVVNQDGEPVKDAIVRALPLTNQSELLLPVLANTDGQGRFVLDGLGPGNMLVEVRSAEYSTKVRPVGVSGENPEVAFELVPRSRVRGRLVGEDVPVGTRLELAQRGEPTLRTTVQPGGVFSFDGSLSAGSAELSLPDGEFCFRESASRWVAVHLEEDGQTELNQPLEPASLVRGVVRDFNGDPLAGVRVLWLSATAGLLENLSLVAVSDAQGRYEVRGLPRGISVGGFGVNWFVYQRPGYGVVEQGFSGARPGEVAELEPVKLLLPGTIHGSVTRGGEGVAGAVVYIGTPSRSTHRVVTGFDGVFVLRDLPEGRYRVKASHATMPLVLSDSSTEVRAGEEAGPVELKLPPGRTLSGVVRAPGPDAAPIGGARIEVLGMRGVAFSSGADGEFNLEVPDRDVELRVFANDELTVHTTVSVPATEDRVEVELPMVPCGTVEAKILGLPGRLPQPGGILRIESLDGDVADETRDRQRNVPSRWVSMNTGELRLLRFPAGRSRITLQCPGYAPLVREIELQPRQTVDLGDQHLEPGARVLGVVRDPDGQPLEAARVHLGKELDLVSPRLVASAVLTDEDGAFTIHGISAYSGDLVVSADGYATKTYALRVPEDLLRDDPVPIALNEGSMISVCVDQDSSPSELNIVLLKRSGRMVDWSRTDEDGCAVFENRSPGLYEIDVLGVDSATQEVVVGEESRKYEVVVKT